MTEEDKEKYETDHELYSKTIECENCAAEYTITYDYDNQDDLSVERIQKWTALIQGEFK